jgi:DNA cross-link repair 1B protein
MGNILHTGDFRFSPKMLEQMTSLYPINKKNMHNEGCSIPIDELILDDTYCDPVFKFPKRVL